MSQEQAKSKNALIFGILGAAVVALLIGAVLFGGSTEETGSPQITGSLPQMPGNVAGDPAFGLAAPTVVGADYGGNEVRIEDDGRSKAIVFLAHWCQFCQAEVPSVQAWLDATGGVEGVDMYSVATAVNSARSNYPPSTWLESEGWTVPIIRDDAASSVLDAYGNGAFPYWVFTNSDGTVALRIEGSIPVNDLQAIMESLS